MKWLSAIELALNGLGICVGLADIESILGICLLVVNIGIIVFRLIFRIVEWYKAAKDEKSDGGERITADELKEGLNILEDAKEGVENLKDSVEKDEK